MNILDLALSQTHLYALLFLLGSFSVATLSDLKRMSAQHEFLEIWILFVLGFLSYDVYSGYHQGVDILFLLKWGLIAAFLIVWIFNFFLDIALGDAMACVAVMALLTPPFIVFFILLLKILDLIFSPLLKFTVGEKKKYPFMPMVFFSTLTTFFVGLYVIDWLGGTAL